VIPLPILIGLGLVLGYIVLSPAGPLGAPSQPPTPPAPPPPGQGGGGTPGAGPTPLPFPPAAPNAGNQADAVPPFVPGFPADATFAGGAGQDLMVPLGGGTPDLSVGPSTMQHHAPLPSPMQRVSAHHSAGSWQHAPNPWLDHAQPEWTADGQAIFRNTAGDIVYCGPWYPPQPE